MDERGWEGVTRREVVGVTEAVTLDDLEAALWRRGLDAAGVDEVIELALRFAARPSFGGCETGEEGVDGGQDRGWMRGGERLSEGVERGSWGGIGPGQAGEELAGSRLGAAGVSAGRDDAREGVGEKGIGDPLTRERLSTASPVGAEKTCAVCRVRQPLADYYRDRNKADGRRRTCKGCEQVRRKLRARELRAVRRLAAVGGDPAELLAAIEARATAERELRLAWARGRAWDSAALLDDATLAVVLGEGGAGVGPGRE